MSIVLVAIPLLKGKRRFHFQKGRPWSLIEHVFLAAVVNKPRTVDDLATIANVPRRLVLEALIRLMRAGWVVLSQNSEGVIFSATKAGKEVVDDEELPQVSKNTSRWMNFVIDKITGTLYRSRELPFLERHRVQERAEQECLVWLDDRDDLSIDETVGVLDALFDDDEKFLSVEESGDRLVDRFAVITVRNGNVEGLPARAPSELENLIKAAAKKAPVRPEGNHSPTFNLGPAPDPSERGVLATMDTTFNLDDLILGGKVHLDTLIETLKRARYRIIIHSTFISADGFKSVWPLLHDAAKRGAIIDIFWGEDEEKTGTVTTKKTVNGIREKILETRLEASIRVHLFSTRSHSKILIADDGRSKNLLAIVGSCNWLSTDFQSYDASARFNDPLVVSGILKQIAELTRGSDGHWTELTNEMTRLAVETNGKRRVTGIKAKVTIVLGPQHGHYVTMAKNGAARRMFVTSHRLGAATRPAVIVPAIAAVKDRGLDVKAYYGVQSGNVNRSEVARLTSTAREEGIQILPVVEPRLHAKILAWDDDNLLITSQNWLSADPNESNIRREIGVFIQASGVARAVINDFEASREN
jgi:cardiolipin synthase